MAAVMMEPPVDSRDSSDEEEPWDQRGRGGGSASVDSSTLRAAAVHEQLLQEGELPTLASSASHNKKEAPVMVASSNNETSAAALSSTRSPPRAGWLLRSGQTQRRPLQPPSLAGLDGRTPPAAASSGISPTESEKNRQQRFWSQLDATNTTDDDDDGDYDDGPHDELAARKPDDEDTSGAALDRIMGKHFGTEDDNRSTAEETIEYSQHADPAGKNTSQSDGDFCGQTLTAINEMCGGGLEQTNSTEGAKADPPVRDRAITPRLPLKSDQQEEYTAIEVEFVESAGKGKRSPTRTPPLSSRKGNAPTSPDVPDDEKEEGMEKEGHAEKSATELQEEEERVQPDTTAKRTAFLSALARKAKADFDKTKSARQKVEEHQGIESKSSGDSLDDDIYSSFSAPEKRKFLKLINTGHLPVDASRKILEARAAKEKAQQEKKEQAANRKNQRSKRLAFWKKNRSSPNPIPPPTPSRSLSADEADIEEEEDPADDDVTEREVDESVSEEETQADSPQRREAAIPVAAMSAMIALEVKNPRPPSPPPPPPLEEMEAILPGATEESEEERFARSGINYYDAVRREASDTDDEVAQVEAARVATPTDKKKRRVRPRGFSALREGVRSKSAPRPGRIPEPVSEDEPVHFSTQSKTMDSATVESLQAVPTNHTHEKRAQSKGWVGEGEDIYERKTEEEATLLAIQAAAKTRSGFAPPRNLDGLAAQRRELPTPKEASHDAPNKSRGLTVADVSQTKKIEKADEEMLARIEQELLSSTPQRSTAPKRTTEAASLPKRSAKGRSVSSPRQRPPEKEALLGEEKKKQNDFQLALDVDIDTYMHSADVYSNTMGRETPYSDMKSVATGATGATGASAYTMSSRKRRPGAAKTRLAKAKEMFQKQAANKKGLGWHDSIQAAAASTNRVWKPGKGWVDYVDTPDEAIQSPKSEEKIQINLKKALAKNTKDELEVSQRSVVPVPFPKDWETERERMIASGASTSTPKESSSEKMRSPVPSFTRSIAPSPVGSEFSSPPVERTSVSSPVSAASRSIDVLGEGMPTEPSYNEPLPVRVENASPAPMRRSEKVKRMKKHFSPAKARLAQKQEKNQDKPTGWIASMQAATAALNQDGKSWDVEHGWSMPDEDEHLISDVVDFNAGQISDVVDFDDPVPPPPPPTSKPPVGSPVDVLRQSPPPPPPTSHRGPDGKLTQWVEKSVKGAKAGTSTADISERAVASGASTTDPDLDNSGLISAAVVGVTTEAAVDLSDRVLAAGVSTESEVYSSNRVVAGVSTESDVEIAGRSAVGVIQSGRRMPHQDSNVVATEPPKQRSGTSADPYVQISDTGSVRAHDNNAVAGKSLNNSAHKKIEPEKLNISNESIASFSSPNDRPASAAVDIQKIDEDDLNLFPEETREKRADRGYIASPARTPPPRKKSPAPGTPMSPPPPPPISAASSADSSRRGGGPVDTDEVDETWDSEDEGRRSTAWESRSGVASANSKATPTPTKTIPKLKGSKRDTSPLRSHRLLSARPGPESDVLSEISASKPEEPLSPGVKSVKRQVEARSLDGLPEWPNEKDGVVPPHEGEPTAEWKSFIGKKVHAETAAASQQRAQGQNIRGVRSEDEDSLFQFEEKKQSNASPGEFKKSGLSPIKARNLSREQYSDGEDQPESVVYGSEGYGPTPQDGRTFLQRLTECAAPVMASAKNQMGPLVESARNSARDLPSAHLAFMKNGQFSAPCGKPDVIDEEATVDLSQASASVQEKTEKPRSKSTPKPRSELNSKPRRGGSSVASEDFGAKTAYLEAIAMKAAVSKPRRSSSRSRGASGSVASSTTSQHSEKWKSFLEKKKASDASPAKGRSSNVSDVSKAAERYAAAKVEEMMAEMNANSVSSPGGRKDVISRNKHSEDTEDDYRTMQAYRNRDGSRVGAAQELSAARVEAMMAQLSASVDEAEI